METVALILVILTIVGPILAIKWRFGGKKKR